MFIRIAQANGKRRGRGFTVLEILIASALFSLVTLTIMSVYLYCSKTFAVMASYAELDQNNRVALDTMTKELRQAEIVTGNSSNSITFYNLYGQSVTYEFLPATRELVRMVNGGSSSVLLTNCSLLNFYVGIRVPNTTNLGFYPWYPTNTPNDIKAVWFSWKAQKTVPGLANTVSEDIQTAKVVIRAAGTSGL